MFRPVEYSVRKVFKKEEHGTNKVYLRFLLDFLGGALGVVAWFSYTALFAISGVNYDTLMAFEYQRRAMASEKKLKKYHEARMDQDRIHSLSQFQDSMVDNPKSPIQNQTSKESSSNSSNNNVVNVTPVQVSKQLQNS